ncbi:glycine-rich domain-containing protein 1-like [Haliotis rubra]|uniref:glycine-rich domain-containing protein 1-like n=1 Tax=Haliotis rubra TaxID=36100 RepID=UPI001EE54E3E|nr:glycine-rich domain-containing protein 1-like [Haliotis rubra]
MDLVSTQSVLLPPSITMCHSPVLPQYQTTRTHLQMLCLQTQHRCFHCPQSIKLCPHQVSTSFHQCQHLQMPQPLFALGHHPQPPIPEFTASSVTLDDSLNLLMAAKYQIDFLRVAAQQVGLHHTGPVLDYAIQRYEKYWLPLCAKHSDQILSAPVDIEWVWHCHLLCPLKYKLDCLHIVGMVIDHRLLSRTDREDAVDLAQTVWEDEYPHIPFHVCQNDHVNVEPHFKSQFTYDIAAAALRQTVFYYQVSLPHYQDEKFLKSCVMRYKQFLYAKKHHPRMFLVPCYDMDLIWHTHQLHPRIYARDTLNLIGQIFDHDDSVNDRSPGSKLNKCDAQTRVVWKRTFQQNFALTGAMYRGEPPQKKLHNLSKDDVNMIATKKTDILLEKVVMDGYISDGKKLKLHLWYRTGYQNFGFGLSVEDTITVLRGFRTKFERGYKVMKNFSFDTKFNHKICADLCQKEGVFCFSGKKDLGRGWFDLKKVVQDLDSKGLSTDLKINIGSEATAQCSLSIPTPTRGVSVFKLVVGQYETCIMPENVQQIWGPIPLSRLPIGVPATCSVASHKLLNHMKKVEFTCRIIHSLPLLMSAVQIFYHDKMAAVAHLVGPDQIPRPEQVSNTSRCVTLEPRKGERAVLIKNHSGDWGFVRGQWLGIRRGIPGVKGQL